ncbi:MAG TPA: hypothetical protein VFI27_03310 [candidate division Zixibacteria bacterium]|nr:hypothetical protein [candidate division Zixibacteria bacterium]
MDSFFGIGLPELIFILLLSGLVMGPNRIRQVARTLGRTTAQLQRVARQFALQLNAELDSLEDDTVRNSYNDFRDLRREVQELRRELGNVPNSLRSHGQDLVDETQESLGKTSTTVADTSLDSSIPTLESPPTSDAEPSVTSAPKQVATSLPDPTATPVPSLPKAIEVPEHTDRGLNSSWSTQD